MTKFKMSVTTDAAEKLIKKTFDDCEIASYGRIFADKPFFVCTFIWLNPALENIVYNSKSMSRFLANIFTCAGMSEEEIIKSATNIFKFYNDSDLVYDVRDEDGY